MCAELSFRSAVKNIKLTLKHIIVVLESKIFIYELVSLKLINSFDTLLNLRGLISINPNPNNPVLAFQSPTIGHVSLYKITTNTTNILKAHQSNISCMQLNENASMIATTSDKGTIIRIFDVNN